MCYKKLFMRVTMLLFKPVFLVQAALLLTCTVVNATFPHGCEVVGFGFNQNHLILNDNGLQSFFLIQNQSNRQITLSWYETREVFMSPPLTAKLNVSAWAAFSSDIQNSHFQCFVTEEDKPVKIDCSAVLGVCKYPRVKFALSNQGNYWVSINKTQSQVINEATSKGILLRW